MSNINDGGPAFPVECQYLEGPLKGIQTGNYSGWETGMTLRDYFAAAAVAGVLREFYDPEGQNLFSWELVAEEVYGMADAMLAERNKVSQ
jgi:hypothetical protein